MSDGLGFSVLVPTGCGRLDFVERCTMGAHLVVAGSRQVWRARQRGGAFAGAIDWSGV